jgi:hypothetical protein
MNLYTIKKQVSWKWKNYINYSLPFYKNVEQDKLFYCHFNIKGNSSLQVILSLNQYIMNNYKL